ncbi:hypothetical protein LR48_Vigan01g311700 [Vigna angularis]|uniref:J domain-containing protein n=2 Tax=Phaseolus angularis TaxID=3914 RepID=A0A0L9TST5_PHAAN|nr:uncharacterized protein LOC108321430 [Vigna angularis]KAG2407180.1 uncharacterized protein HKW66_Vig0020020 [Vigna angularis]KOM33561.1 hypothetical protein LR48_Vigan01g311700 [Vigna angularis]BAT77185.1 hypothetical protein VIGAN_01528000 [Vigna angularis var. angularis]
MDCNKEEALRAKNIAEKKMENRDFAGARKIALKAQQLYPDLENIAQMLVVCDVHCCAENKLYGNEIDWYEILQVEQTAVDALIKKQYRKFALLLHPDKNKFAGAEAAFKLIGEAQRVLLDREKRIVFDMKRRVPKNKPATSHFNTTAGRNVRSNFTSSTSQQQQQQQNGARDTFWTVCPFCSVKYQYYKEILKKSLRCQQCNRPFVAYEVEKQGTPSPATNSTQQASDQQKGGLNHGAFKVGAESQSNSHAKKSNIGSSPASNSTQQASDQQKGGLNHGAFKVGAGSQSNSHAEKSNMGSSDKKLPASVSRKHNGKRKKKQVAESSESSVPLIHSDSEEDGVAGKDGYSKVENHSTTREGHLRRSTRKRHQVSYKENLNSTDDGEKSKMNDPNDLPAAHKEVNQKKHLYSGRNEETNTFKGKDVVGGAKQLDETSEHSPNSTSKVSNQPNVYAFLDAEFSDFDKDKRKECFAAGQIWAVYDSAEGMPRFYALIRKVLSPGFKLRLTWFESHPDWKDEMNWVNEELPVACGKYKLGDTDVTEDHLMFSHLVLCEKISRTTFKVYPRKGETWALFKNWDIKWYMDAKSHQLYEYEFVEILTDYVEDEGVYVVYLTKLKGFVSIFLQNIKESKKSFQIPPRELFKFSHRVPSFKMTGEERAGVPSGSYELDPGALPAHFEEKVGDGSSGCENTGTSDRSESLMSEGGRSTPEVNGSNDWCASLVLETIEIPDTHFFNFDAGRSLEKFQIGQIWAFYSDEDGLPKYYGRINKIVTSPDLELHVSWLTCYWLPENTTEWEDKDMGVLISCGRYNFNKTDEFFSIFNTTSCVSHQVHAESVGKNTNTKYAIFPRKGEVWALYRKWTNKMKCSELKNWEYDIVEVIEETDLFIIVLVLEFVSGFNSVFRGKSNERSSGKLRIPRKELLRFSHQIPAFKLTEEHGNLRDFWELDPGALPTHYFGLR